MTDKGAITLAIEALDKVAGQSCAGRNPEGDSYLIDAYEALKAFKDGVPEGLKDNVENIIIRDGYVETINEEGIKDIIVFYKAAKHLQKGIK